MSTGNYTSTNDTFDLALKQARDAVDTLVEANPGFQFVSPSAYNPETNAAIEMMQLEAARAAARDELMALVVTLLPEQQSQMVARIGQLAGANSLAQVNNLKVGLAGEIESARDWGANERKFNDLEAKEDKSRAQLLSDLAAYREDSEKWRMDFADKGYADTPENQDKLDALWAKLDGVEPGSPEYIKTWQEITTMDADYFQRVKEEALKRGDTEAVKKADEAIKATQQAQKDVQALNEGNKLAQGQAAQEHGVDQSSASIFDDEPTVAQTVVDPKGAAVAKTNPLPQQDIVDLGDLIPPNLPNVTPSGGRGIG